MTRTTLLRWTFPLPRTHTGVLLGNGVIGAIVWGEGPVMRVTLGRADFWDHQGGLPWTQKMSYRRIRAALDTHNADALAALFRPRQFAGGKTLRPTILPVGRVDFDLGEGARLRTADLNTRTGLLTVHALRKRTRLLIECFVDMESGALMVHAPAETRAECVPAWRYVGEELKARGFQPPIEFSTRGTIGWSQTCPADPALAVALRQRSGVFGVVLARGSDAASARRNATVAAAAALQRGPAALRRRSRVWWADYWRSVPSVRIPNRSLAELHEYGMHKFAMFTNPAAPPATLQGPWIEEYRLPPWSSDYHFNINVQMCYQPAFHGNRLENLRPLFDMVWSWRDRLRRNARKFVGIRDGFMLPHAVDDRCAIIGNFWTGTVDHACTAWVGLMMRRYARYAGDAAFLRDRAFPFMDGAMRVYEKMLERRGGRFVLPVGVSPEYRGAAINAWGANASFQLAAIHALAEALIRTAAELGKPPRPIWMEIRERLPLASLFGKEGEERIALWDGLPLEESHRHHSHLGGIAPFDVLDGEDPRWRAIIGRSLAQWAQLGMGLWTGWCMSWASMIHARADNPDGAELCLELFERVFTNEGRGTLHDPRFAGLSAIGFSRSLTKAARSDVMQMDGGMGAVAAIQEMLLHTRRGVNHLFAGAPARWRNVSFSGMRTEGAFLLGARRAAGRLTRVDVLSEAGGILRLRNPWQDLAVVERNGRREEARGVVLEIPTARGERLILRPR